MTWFAGAFVVGFAAAAGWIWWCAVEEEYADPDSQLFSF